MNYLLSAFPGVAHDDQDDSISQALSFVAWMEEGYFRESTVSVAIDVAGLIELNRFSNVATRTWAPFRRFAILNHALAVSWKRRLMTMTLQ